MARTPKEPADAVNIVENLAGIGCTMAELATAMGFSESTLRRRPKLMEAIEKGREAGKTTLRRAMWHNAIEKGNIVMQIWLSKNLLGYADKVQQEQVHKGGVLVVPGTLSPEEWSEAVAARAANLQTDAQRVGEWHKGRFVGPSGNGEGH